MKVREIVKLIEEDGWYCVRTKGSHHQYKHQTKPGLVTVPGSLVTMLRSIEATKVRVAVGDQPGADLEIIEIERVN